MKEYNEHHKGTGDGEAEFIEILKKLIRPLFWRGPTIHFVQGFSGIRISRVRNPRKISDKPGF